MPSARLGLGPFVGAGVFIWMRDFLSKRLEYWEVFVGGAFVLIVLFLPEGIVGSLTRGRSGRRLAAASLPDDRVPDPERWVRTRRPRDEGDGPLLESQGLTRSFGGLIAGNGVDFRVRRGELRSVIGPNGAGKTTFFNLLTGVLPPSAGRILFRGQDISRRPPHAVSRLGIARSYQVTNIFGDLTVFENVRIAAQSRVTHYRFWGRSERLVEVSRRADEILQLLGLVAKRNARGAELSHGEQRYLEIGIALATDPDFLLLDEPTAGMSPEETQRTAAFVRKLAGHVTIVLVEHDMEVVMGISDRITVLNYGEVLAEGTPAEIRITWNGADITALPPYRIVQLGIGYVPEERRIFPNLTVYENLKMARLLVDGGRRMDDYLTRVFALFPPLERRLSARGRTLSGGEQQMLTMARSLGTDPRLLIRHEGQPSDLKNDAAVRLRYLGV